MSALSRGIGALVVAVGALLGRPAWVPPVPLPPDLPPPERRAVERRARPPAPPVRRGVTHHLHLHRLSRSARRRRRRGIRARGGSRR